MAVTVVSRPSTTSSAYLPMKYVFTSNNAPNSNSSFGDNSKSIVSIGYPTASQLSFFTDLEEEDVLMSTSGINPATFRSAANADETTNIVTVRQGDYVIITGTTDSMYDGVFKIKKIIFSASLLVLDTAYQGESTGGLMSLYFKDFSIVSDLYIDSVFVVRLRSQRDSNDQFTVDVSRHVQLFLGSDQETLGFTTRIKADNTEKPIYIKYAEEFRQPDSDGNTSIVTQTLTDDSANIISTFNTAIQYVDLRNKAIVSTNYDMSDFNDPSLTDRFLTNQPSTITIGSSDNYQMTYIENRPAFLGRAFVVETFNSANQLIATTQFLTWTVAVTSGQYWAYNFPCGTLNLASIVGSNVKYYDVYMYSTSLSLRISEKKRFKIDRDCANDPLRFEWLNQLGGMDSFTFNGFYDKATSVERKQYKRALSSPRVIPERAYTTTQNKSTDIYTANSGYITLEESEWLQELFNDVESYLIVSSTRLPIQIISDSMTVFSTKDNLFNVSFQWRFAFDKIIQRN